jgi:hypothetical protein
MKISELLDSLKPDEKRSLGGFDELISHRIEVARIVCLGDVIGKQRAGR